MTTKPPARLRERRLLEATFPPLPRGAPHSLIREKQRAAFMIGFKLGKQDTIS